MAHAINDQSKRWPSGIVPYIIDPDLVYVNDVHAAMREWERISNLRFVARRDQKDYIEFSLNTGLLSASQAKGIGKEGGEQWIYLNLTSNNSAGGRQRTIMHEIGHAIGLKHEHQRSDRLQYIRILFDNIIKGRGNGNFEESPKEFLKSQEYDYRSIMHYSSRSFAIDSSLPTIEPLDSSIPLSALGSATEPTVTDLEMVNRIYPDLGVIRRSATASGAGEVEEISSVSDGNGSFISAVKNGSGNLQLNRWSIDDLGSIIRKREAATAGEASNISIERTGTNYVATLKDGSGLLTLISWQLQGDDIVRMATERAGKASLIQSVEISEDMLLTACKNDNGNLLLIICRVDANGGITRLSDSGDQAEEVSEISLAVVESSNSETIVATTVRAGNNDIKIITWAISASGNTIDRRGDSGSQIGEGTLVRSVKSRGFFVVSCKNGSDCLFLVSFTVSSNGSTITRVADSGSLAGKIRSNSMIARNYGIISAVANDSKNLVLIKWRMRTNGLFERMGDSSDQAGEVSIVDFSSIQRATNSPDYATPLVTFAKDGDGNLKLITWDDTPTNGEIQR